MKKNKVGQWFSDHKKELILTGLIISGVGIVVGAVVLADSINGGDSSMLATMGDMVERTNNRVDLKLMDQDKNECDFINDSNVYDFDEKRNSATTRVAHEVNGHVRKLHIGWNASPEKIAEAAERGIELGENQTFVNSYRTGNTYSIG